MKSILHNLDLINAENNLHKKRAHIPPKNIIWIMNKYILWIDDVIWFYKIEDLFLKKKSLLIRKNGFLSSKALMDGKIIFFMYWHPVQKIILDIEL